MTVAFFFSILYSIGQIGLGLLLHPYQTMQSLAKGWTFSWLTLLPTAILAVITVFWRFGLVPVVGAVFPCSRHQDICAVLPFFSDWITFFCIYWQVVLLYLYIRFSMVFRHTR